MIDMPTCKDCIHYDICIFHLKGNENEECVQFVNTADVVARSEVEQLRAQLELSEKAYQSLSELYSLDVRELSDRISILIEELETAKQEVAREIFEEIEEYLNSDEIDDDLIYELYYGASIVIGRMHEQIAELKKKYTEGG